MCNITHCIHVPVGELLRHHLILSNVIGERHPRSWNCTTLHHGVLCCHEGMGNVGRRARSYSLTLFVSLLKADLQYYSKAFFNEFWLLLWHLKNICFIRIACLLMWEMSLLSPCNTEQVGIIPTTTVYIYTAPSSLKIKLVHGISWKYNREEINSRNFESLLKNENLKWVEDGMIQFWYQ